MTSFYVYDSGGQRVRKLTDGQAAAGQTARRQAERIYLGSTELHREYAVDGTTVSLERETLHVDAGDHPIAFVETRTAGTDPAPAQLVRYQLSNHLGSAVLELDDQSNIITYEEYFPFGGTSYQAVANQTDVPKRYRYTDKERDDENDLYYHGARYYAPWLGRWTACDPIGINDGLNLYAYVHDNPIGGVDRTGTECNSAIASCEPENRSESVEQANQRSSESDRLIDQQNDETARYMIAAQTGQLKPQKFDAAQLRKDVDTALQAADSPGQRIARQLAQAEQKRQADYAEELHQEAELDKELPGTAGSVVPLYGSGTSSYVHFSHGNYGRGVAYGVLAISDVFLVKSLIVGGGKLLLRGGAALLAAEAERNAPRLALGAEYQWGAAVTTLPTLEESRTLVGAEIKAQGKGLAEEESRKLLFSDPKSPRLSPLRLTYGQGFNVGQDLGEAGYTAALGHYPSNVGYVAGAAEAFTVDRPWGWTPTYNAGAIRGVLESGGAVKLTSPLRLGSPGTYGLEIQQLLRGPSGNF